MRDRRPAVLLILVLLVLLTAPTLATGQAVEAPWSPSAEESDLADTLRELLNAARAEEGLSALAGDPELDRLAYQHSREMAARGQVTHHSYRFGLGTRSRIRLAFPRVFQFAENVARNRDAAALHAALLSSRGHRLNRLDPSFTHVGMGVARASEYQIYLTEIFVRVAREEQLEMDVLYTAADPATLPEEEPTHGEVTSERVTIGRPGIDDPSHWTGLGIDAFQSGDYARAVAHFRRALELGPGYDFARFNLARALLRAGQPGEALDTLDAYLASNPDDVDAWRTVGTAALVSEDYARAEGAFRRVLSSRARDAGAWYNLGLSIEYQDRPEEAERAYAQALHLDPDLEPARDALRRVRG